MNSKNLKKFLTFSTFTAAAVMSTGIGTTAVIDFIKNTNSELNVNKQIMHSYNNESKLTAALVIDSLDANSYKFKLLSSGTKNLKVFNRYFYEIENGVTKSFIPEWDNQLNAYTHTVKRGINPKIVVYTYDVKLIDGNVATVVSNDYNIRPSLDFYALRANKVISKQKNVETVSLRIPNYDYSDELKVVWEKKYDVGLTTDKNYTIYTENNFSNEFNFNKEICGKYMRVSLFEKIFVPVGLYTNGETKYEIRELKTNLSDEIYIYPGIFSSYKLKYDFLDQSSLKIDAVFKSDKGQKELEYKILDWQVKNNSSKWTSLNKKSKTIVVPFSINDFKQYRLVYMLKNGSKNDLISSNVLNFESMINASLEIKNGKLIVNLPEYINKYDVSYSWFKKESNQNIFKKLVLDNDAFEYVLTEQDLISNPTFKVTVKYRNILFNYTLNEVTVPANLETSNKVNVEVSSSLDDVVVIKANNPFENVDDQDVEYIWGSGSEILSNKKGNVASFIRQELPKKYWVYAIYNNEHTSKTYFDVTEAFKPNFDVVNSLRRCFVKINNLNLDRSAIKFSWETSVDSNRWVKNPVTTENIFKPSDDTVKFVRVRLMYKEANDILISHIVTL